MTLDALTHKRLTGDEPFVGGGRIADDAPATTTVLDFWRWSAMASWTRCVLARVSPREEWRAYDLETKDAHLKYQHFDTA